MNTVRQAVVWLLSVSNPMPCSSTSRRYDSDASFVYIFVVNRGVVVAQGAQVMIVYVT
jgi:hypothetical protein